jgi:hypothetical protein
MQNDPDMLEEYDFSKGIKGKYSQKYNEGTNVIVNEPDIKKYFKVMKVESSLTVGVTFLSFLNFA